MGTPTDPPAPPREIDSATGSFPGTVLITGATGTIGWHIASQLAGRADVRALVRDVDRAKRVLPDGVEAVRGDLTDPRSLPAALDGVHTVFHAAGMPEQWVRDRSVFDRVNVGGTRAIARAALAAGVGSFVHTSTIDVLAKSPGQPFDELTLETRNLDTPYQRSKQDADRVVIDALGEGLPARLLHPSALFGPSPSRTPGVNDILAGIANRQLPALPSGGLPVVYAPDVARGHILAATAPVGSRYILSDAYVPLAVLADIVVDRAPRARRPLFLPDPVARAVSAATETLSRFTHRPPMLPAGQLHFLSSRVMPDNGRAVHELGWHPTPLDEAVAETLARLG